MICITGNERTTTELEARLCGPHAAALHEVRADTLVAINDDLFGLLARHPAVVFTCRSAAEGGGFSGTDAELLALYERALTAPVRYVDVELHLPEEARERLWEKRGDTKLLLSSHVQARDPRVWAQAAERLMAARADLLKIAVAIEDAAELGELLSLFAGESRPTIKIGMGPAGVLSRVLYERFASPWTYAPLSPESATAAGQLTVDALKEWRVGARGGLAPIGLLGGIQVLRSPGPRVYNRVFAARNLPWVYLPLVTSRPADTLQLLEGMNSPGASITMPCKTTVLPCLSALDEEARACGAVNTVVLRNGERRGLNTDGYAVASLLEKRRRLSGTRVLVLGAGGAARAAASSLAKAGARVTVAARHLEPAEALTAATGLELVDWERRLRTPFDILVQATPVGSDGQSDPMLGHEEWRGKIVLDMVLTEGPSPLCARARVAGAEVIPGLEMWLLQGARQLRELVRIEVSPEMLRAAFGKRDD